MAQPGQPLPPTIYRDARALARLHILGIAPARLIDALVAGDQAARQADRFSPTMAAGSLRWLETARMLRAGLASDGWTLNDDRNLPRVVRPDGQLAVAPTGGTADTGLIDGTPRRANPRPGASSRAVHVNGQLELGFPEGFLADMAGEKTGEVMTYWLLYFRSEPHELRAELSLPVSVSDHGETGDWKERILLPPQRFGAAVPIPLDVGGDDDSSFAIEVR